MFGSKLRSWMENHIVRPRKKGNKNKNASSNLVSANSTQNGHKGTTGVSIYPGEITTATQQSSSANTISSPARRSEVSPIQSHTTSRFGWQSPKQETAMSPKSDRFLYMHTVKSHTISSSAPLSVNNLIVVKATSSSTSSPPTTDTAIHLSHASMPRKCSYYASQESDSIQRVELGPAQAPNVTTRNHQQNNESSNYSPQRCIITNNMNKKSSKSTNNKHSSNMAYPANASSSSYTGHYEAQSDVNFKNNNNNNTNNMKNNQKTILSSQQQSHRNHTSSNVEARYQNGAVKHGDENRYGKLLPSKKSSGDNFGSLGNFDNLNANIQFQTCSNGDGYPQTITNNNAQVHPHAKQPSIPNGSQCPKQHPQYHHQGSGQMQPRNGSETNRNMLRTTRYNNGTMLGPANNHPLAHVINSLSSPESAYSTGYSTDGTSPGATYTPPEYYINMRTGTHYFPKSVNTLAIEASRFKFGLNKIEEMSPQDPLPNSHRRTESFDLGQQKIPGFGIPDPCFYGAKNIQCLSASPIQQRHVAMQNYKGFESPSPRQRCRIRTNPWYSTTETSSSGSQSFLTKKVEIDASSSSSGIKSSSDAGGASDRNDKIDKSSDSETSSSSTEVEVAKKTFSPGTIRRRKLTEPSKSETHAAQTMHQESDDDATLNEMMGKFDESYVYEKETDILSDSDPTDCASDLDTGQDAGDECDTDELLDIDFIDNGSIQEISEKDPYKNTGSCSYFNYQLERRASKMRRSRKQNEDTCSAKRRKRLMKTRKKSAENKDKGSPIRNIRESRSLGGTPVCLRRNQSADSKKYDSLALEILQFNRDLSRTHKISPLTNRSNSLTFTEVHAIRGRFLAIAESEKALLKADMEADVKYKQLIHEAETILVSMKTSTTALKETPVASPRRICNVPTNKRVEMLRNCEADLRREASRQKSVDPVDVPLTQPTVDGVIVNKRLESLRYETNSAPNSPKSCRFSPRKTHVTNFINQIVPPVEAVRRNSSQDVAPKSPQLQLNGRKIASPPMSPSSRRRVRSQSPRVAIYSDSDSEEENSKQMVQRKPMKPLTDIEMNGNRKNDANTERLSRRNSQKMRDLKDDLTNRNVVPEFEKITLYDESDYTNRNIIETKKPSLMSFRSIDMGNRTSVNSYCPQSEPLKRKIYKGSSTFERIKKSLDLEDEVPKQAILEKITNLRKERQALKNTHQDANQTDQCNSNIENAKPEEETNVKTIANKRLLILNTIEDLKRSLEDQSVELCGLNDDPNE